MNVLNFTPFPVLYAERLTLRQVTQQDDNEMFSIRSDESIRKFLDRPKAVTIEDARKFIQRISGVIEKNESILWGICPAGTNKIIGTICLWNFTDDNYSAEIGYEMLPDFQGKGYMNEALVRIVDYGFNTINLKTITAHTHPKNTASLKLLERNGFIYNSEFEGFSVYIKRK